MTAEALHKTDIDAALQLESDAGPYCWSRGDWLDSVENDHCFKWLLNEELVAVAAFSSVCDEVSLLNIAVRKQEQGRGHAAAFLRHCLGDYARQGMKHCFLEVRRSNKAAIALYKKLGFNSIGERKDYYPITGGREDALVMLCPIQRIKHA